MNIFLKQITWYLKTILFMLFASFRVFLYGLAHPKVLYQLIFAYVTRLNEIDQHVFGQLKDFKSTKTFSDIKKSIQCSKTNYFHLDPKVIHPVEVAILSQLVSYLKPQKLFEIGTYSGFTTYHFSINAPEKACIYTLDLPKHFKVQHKEDLKNYSYDDLNVIELSKSNVDRRVYRNTPAEQKIKDLFGDSREFDFAPYYGKIDLVYIDGNHSYDYVKSDTEQALKMVRENGVIVWHDYDFITHSDVFRYLNELSKTLPIYSIANSRFAIYGPKL